VWERVVVIVNTSAHFSTGDGRLRRGEAKRRQILSAALRVIARNGVAGATQRSVAAEARVSPTLVVYHFDTIENMLAESLMMAHNHYLSQARAAIADGSDPLAALAGMIAASTDENSHLSVAEFELYLKAAHDPRILRILEKWWSAVDEMVLPAVPDPVWRRTLILTADGMFLRQVVPGHAMSPDDILNVLRTIAGAGRTH
jgi:TetR/AcrR family transcriptional regulator, regulator of biofilm formation and stress response